jgi:uncharacterized protein YyaL (SSP411 family)
MKNLFFLMLILLVLSCQNQNKPVTNHDTREGNHLKNESSPYLLQHAKNPVDWYPWKEEALEKAKRENKMIIISVGYSSCHWCHVMEEESFEDEEVAALMNENFVTIKVDREERPDVDDVYMSACQLSSGRGCGWPLNAFALPDGRPVWAGTYFPKKDWVNILKQFIEDFKTRPDKLEEYATSLTAGIQKETNLVAISESPNFQQSQLENAFETIFKRGDFKKGGREGAPKFPMPNIYESLLRYADFSKNEKAGELIEVTLDNMANGGIYDQIGGGFARYSTDEDWHIPHFEKMLYDNSQLVSLYAHGYQMTKKSLYKEVVEETLEFVERELMDKNGGFYSSLDADSEGEEGKFYVWEKEAIEAALNDEIAAKVFNDYYDVRKNGNWEETNVFRVTKSKSIIAKNHKITVQELNDILAKSEKLLLKERSKRIRPNLDDKILTSWNGLMLKGYIDAYKAFGNEKYLKTALRNAKFLTKNMMQKDGRLNRNYKDGKSVINAFLDDYANLAEAFIGLYEVTFDEKWLEKSKQLTDYATTHFYDKKSGLYFYTSDLDAKLITRKMEIYDNVISGSNSVMAKNLFKLGTYFYDKKMLEHAQKMLQTQLKDIERSAGYAANWLDLYLYQVNPPYEVAVLGKGFNEKRKALQAAFLPNTLFLGGSSEGDLALLKGKLIKGETMIYVCKNRSCKLPVSDVNAALGQMK